MLRADIHNMTKVSFLFFYFTKMRAACKTGVHKKIGGEGQRD